MDAGLYITILRQTFLPFLSEVYPAGHRLMQDNDPKHTSRRAQEFYEEEGINWWRTPLDSPDMNLIENLWHEIKEHLRSGEVTDEARAHSRDSEVVGDSGRCQVYPLHSSPTEGLPTCH